MLDRREIVELTSRYAFLVDTFQLLPLMQLWVDDEPTFDESRVDLGNNTGLDNIRRYFEEFEGSIHCQVLFEEHYVGMVRAGHPAIRNTLSFERFLQTPHLVYHPSGGGHSSQESFVDNAFCAAGLERRVAVRVAHTMGIASIVSSTDLLVVVPHRLARACAEHVDVTILELPIEMPSFHIAQYWHERFHADPGNRWLRGLFAQLYGGRQSASVNPAGLATALADS